MKRVALPLACLFVALSLCVYAQDTRRCAYVVKQVSFENPAGLTLQQLATLRSQVVGRCYDPTGERDFISDYVYEQLKEWGYNRATVYEPGRYNVLDGDRFPATVSLAIDFRLTGSDDAKKASNPYEKWLDEDVHWIITADEQSEFRSLRSDQERDSFVERFWGRRDPTPNTAENEYKEEHYRRLAYANAHFASGIPGWKTDRGRTYVIFGPPDVIKPVVAASGGAGRPTVWWIYKSLPGIGKDVRFKFVDVCNCGDYRGKSVRVE